MVPRIVFFAAIACLGACSVSPPSESAASSEAVVGDPFEGNALTVFILPRASDDGKFQPIDYSSPFALVGGLARNSHVGHTLVELKCRKSDAVKDGFEQFQAQTGGVLMDGDIQQRGHGFGIMFDNYDGIKEEGDEIRTGRNLDQRIDQGAVSFIRYRISDAMCGRLVSYLNEYNEQKLYRSYGLLNDPLARQGAGCTGFGMGFLRVAGLMTPEYEEKWQQSLDVPEEFIGGPSTARPADPNDPSSVAVPARFVTPASLLLKFSWKTAGATRHATFWEPNLIHKWTLAEVAKEKATPTTGRKVVKLQTGKPVEGLEIDATATPVPTGPTYTTPAPSDPAEPQKPNEESPTDPTFEEDSEPLL